MPQPISAPAITRSGPTGAPSIPLSTAPTKGALEKHTPVRALPRWRRPTTKIVAQDLIVFAQGRGYALTPWTGTHSTAHPGSHHAGTRAHARCAGTHACAAIHTAGTHACATYGRYGG